MSAYESIVIPTIIEVLRQQSPLTVADICERTGYTTPTVRRAVTAHNSGIRPAGRHYYGAPGTPPVVYELDDGEPVPPLPTPPPLNPLTAQTLDDMAILAKAVRVLIRRGYQATAKTLVAVWLKENAILQKAFRSAEKSERE